MQNLRADYNEMSSEAINIIREGTDFKVVLKKLYVSKNRQTNQTFLMSWKDSKRSFALCEKALADYLETKRLAFPRFYFRNGSRHLTNCLTHLSKLEFDKSDQPTTYEDKASDAWIQEYPAQIALCGNTNMVDCEVKQAFTKLKMDMKMREGLSEKQVNQLNTLIVYSSTRQERQESYDNCTIDVHSRDVLEIDTNANRICSSFSVGESQLRHRWDGVSGDCYAKYMDAELMYWYEYLGNTPRLVITPVSLSMYSCEIKAKDTEGILARQMLHNFDSVVTLDYGGAPADLQKLQGSCRALGMMVYVFNCSEQMDVPGLFRRIQSNTVKCFLLWLFNQDAIRDKKTKFVFMGEDIALNHTVGLFITMNRNAHLTLKFLAGYAGRSELPGNVALKRKIWAYRDENLKFVWNSHNRKFESSISSMRYGVPDFELICEIMLVAEGFQEARILARKFITLYTLCKELLSKQDHY
ncbi:Dynein beta chain, ciliary [Orchesella cincta]|uniref:Dynein beta chain, ciliary n=1 Tax=Orchesella cincta TaxID=48709 RepID=A0A1D2MVC0_ORCCI|nr:Dynein beta chain, ciliary [Orchesella cincta]